MQKYSSFITEMLMSYVYLASSMRATSPAASGAEADVPV